MKIRLVNQRYLINLKHTSVAKYDYFSKENEQLVFGVIPEISSCPAMLSSAQNSKQLTFFLLQMLSVHSKLKEVFTLYMSLQAGYLLRQII